MLDYYTVNYFTYKLAENGINYELKSDAPYRRQIVRSGCTTHAASDAYVQGLTFRRYSTDQWNWVSGDAHSEYDYANTNINHTTNLYAQFAQPKVEVNEFVRTDVSGTVTPDGTDFRIANATVSGYDVGENAIQSVHIAMKDVTSVKVLEIPEGCTVTPEGADALENGGTTSVKSMTVRFSEKVSMAAQQWLRDNLVFTPVQPETNPLTCEVKITVSDSDITTAQSTENEQEQVAEATKLTGGVRTEIFIQNPVTLTKNATIPSNTKVTIEKPMHVYEGGTADETNSSGTGYIGQTTGGTLTIAEGVTLTNHGIITNNGNLTIENDAVLHNMPDAMFENKAETPYKLTLTPANGSKVAGKLFNEGIMCNEGEADIPNGGIDNRGESENADPGGQLPVSADNSPKMPFGGMAEYDEATSTYKLTGNVILKDTLEFTSGEWKLDLNGYTLTGPQGKPAVKVTGASLILTDSNTIADADDNIDSFDPSRRAGKIQGGNGYPNDGVNNGTQGSAGIEIIKGSVMLNEPVAVYGGTGGLGIDGKDGGAGGDGIIHTGGTLMIGNGALVQGGNGGNAMIQSDSSTPLGNGGTGGSAINTSKSDYVINSGTAAEAPETEGEIYKTNGKLKTPNITQRPGKTGKGYTHTVREIMNKEEPMITAPTAKNPIYTGRKLQLIEAGSIETGHGTLYYALSDSGTEIPVDGWTTAATDMRTVEIGDYYVWYHSVGNADYYDSEYVAIHAPLLRKTPSIIITPTTSVLTYDGTEKTIATLRNSRRIPNTWRRIRSITSPRMIMVRNLR